MLRLYPESMARKDCPHCGGTGWKVVEADNRGREAAYSLDQPGAGQGAPRVAVRCECSMEDQQTRVLTRARIPPKYERCSFESFFSRENTSLEQAKIVAQAFARDYPVGIEHGLLLMGPPGVGKTHLAVAALREIVGRGHQGVFYAYNELLKEIQNSYNPQIQTTEMAVLEPVLTTELLVLDDLGSSKPSLWALETVGHILITRYNHNRLTILTTNYLDGTPAAPVRFSSGQTAPRMEEFLADRIGLRIRSRLYEMCRTLEMIAPDYRPELDPSRSLRA